MADTISGTPDRGQAAHPTAGQPASDQVSHLFQVQLRDTLLTKEQAERIAEAIRGATREELLKLDFRIEELKPLFNKSASSSFAQCGGGCQGCSH